MNNSTPQVIGLHERIGAISGRVSLKGAAAGICALLLTACGASTITIEGSYPTPLVGKLPLTVGVFYDDSLANYSFTELNDSTGEAQYIINSGPSQVALFNAILPAVFEGVVRIDDLDEVGEHPNLDAVFVPLIEEFQVGLPAKTRLNVYEIWVKYNMRLSETNGDQIADWVMTAYGKTPDENFQSVDAGINDAAVVALRDLAASFTLGFASIPEVREWLRENDVLAE